MHDEQSSERHQPGGWQPWTPPAGQQGQSAPNEPGQPADAGRSELPGQPELPGQSGGASQPGVTGEPGVVGQPDVIGEPSAAGQPGATGQPRAFTQPIGYPQAAFQAPGYGQPGGYGPQGEYGQPGAYGQSGEYGQQSSYGPQGGYYQAGFGQPGYGPGQPGGYDPGQPGGRYGPGQPGGYGPPPGGYGQPPRRRRGLATAITYIAVAAVAATTGGLLVGIADHSSQPAASSPSGGSGSLGLPNSGSGNPFGNNGSGSGASVSSATLRKVEDAVSPGLVVIDSNLKYQGRGAAAAATGMIISKSGLVLTNNHVISGTTGLTATVVATGRQYQAKWLGYDKSSDVAVIQLQGASSLKTVPLGNSSTVKLGDNVVGMGNAGGSGGISSVVGSITGTNQTITASDSGSGTSPERLTGMFQTNADIIPGDSGGPLANVTGQVIGMDTAASTDSIVNGQQNVGFAIPINKAMGIARQIIAGQASSTVHIGSTGFVGVLVPGGKNGQQSTQSNPSVQLQQQVQAQKAFGGSLPATNQCLASNGQAGVPSKIAPVSSGTLVLGSLCRTPAAQVGLVPGDVITKVNGRPVTSPASLMNILQAMRGGSKVTLTWVTPSDQSVVRTLTLAPAPPQ